MPELPEVETIRRQLAPVLEGRTIACARVPDSLWCSPTPASAIERALKGRRIERLERRGKYLLVELSDGTQLVVHLRMTGNLLWEDAGEQKDEPKHLRVRLDFDDGSSLRFVDPRRFGTGEIFPDRESLDAYLDERLGPEPLQADFTAEVLARAASKRSVSVKAFLLDQRRVAGIGNIYADEALFRAKIHPLRPVGRLRRPDIERLRDSIVASLQAGIAAEGASIDDYRHYNGESGGMQDEFLVHLREDEPCPDCGRPIVKLRVAGRGTYLCRSCQPAPRNPTKAR